MRKRSIATSFYTKFLHVPAAVPREIGRFSRGEPIAQPVPRMLALLADRFICRAAHRLSADGAASTLALDLATGERVRLRIFVAGTREEQHAWVEGCMRAHLSGSLRDYGFIGKNQRFEAIPLRDAVTTTRQEPASADVIEWLDGSHPSSPRVLLVQYLPDARELRVRGFVAIRLSLLRDPSQIGFWPLLHGRSVVLLDAIHEPDALALALLKLRRADARDTCALRLPVGSSVAVDKAAESRAAYEARPPHDTRPTAMLTEGERLLAVGRHAAADRALRAAIGAFDRRGDTLQAGRSELTLGIMLLTRGRASDAVTSFERAHDRFQRARAPVPAISAMVHLGIAQTDLSLLCEAERSCRAAYSAASAVKDGEATAASGVGLARVLLWQERHAEARDLVESLAPPLDAHMTARYWCLVARLRLLGNGFRDARVALEHARPTSSICDATIESLVRRWEAVVQARLGDVQALEFHVRAGLAAARAAHLPLQAMKLRLTLIEGLIQAGRIARARAVAARLRRLTHTVAPPLLRSQIERVLARSVAPDEGDGSQRSRISAREAAGVFCPAGGTTLEDLDAVRAVLAVSHQHEDEGEALARAAATVRKHLHALGVGIYASVGGEPRLFGSAGTTATALARRSCGAGIAIGPERTAGGIEAAIPMRYLGRLIGALSIRWSVEGPPHAERAIAFCGAAAAASAPVVYVLLERQSVPAINEADGDLIGTSPAIEDVRRAIRRAANAPFTVLIEGESGSGKELVARAIHRTGPRRERRLCAFNCAAMPEDLVDAELFGHAKGAFTGAAVERLGLFESADGGTVFLDEVGELSARAQAKVLRALQEGEVRRVGEAFTRPFDARLVAATNKSLRAEVEAGRFRQDLLYRLDVIRIIVPPLRDRAEDIPPLAALFWRAATVRIGSKAVLGQSALSALARYDWPGNVRELQNVLTALVVAAPSRGVVGASDLPAAIARATHATAHESLESARLKFEQRFVRAALAKAAGHRGRTAAALGLSRQGLAKLLQRLGLDDQGLA